MSKAALYLIDQAWEAIDAGNFLRARSLIRRISRSPDRKAELLHLLGRLSLETGSPAAALGLLERSRALQGDEADLLYDLGLAHEALGRPREMAAAFVQVLDLDGRAGEARKELLSEEDIVAVAESELAALPGEILDHLGNVPIFVEERPARYLVEEGFDPRALGLFDGLPYPEQGGSGPALCRIVLYRANLAAASRSRGEAEELVRTTLLHETAHFYGLDEDELAARGLD